jgi:hypothetical protein
MFFSSLVGSFLSALSVFLSVCLSVSLLYLSNYLGIITCPSVSLFFCPSICLFSVLFNICLSRSYVMSVCLLLSFYFTSSVVFLSFCCLFVHLCVLAFFSTYVSSLFNCPLYVYVCFYRSRSISILVFYSVCLFLSLFDYYQWCLKFVW